MTSSATHSLVTWRERKPITTCRGIIRALKLAREHAEQTRESVEVWQLERGLRREKRAVIHPADTVARVVLVGCSKLKRTEEAPARELYDPSALFRKQLAVARQEVRSTRIFIVSAKYRLVSQQRLVKPYEYQISDMSAEERKDWADWIIDDLNDRMSCWFYEDGWEQKRKALPLRALEVVLMMGASYARPLRAAAPDDWTIEEPLAGMQIGERLQWLNRAIRRAEKGQART